MPTEPVTFTNITIAGVQSDRIDHVLTLTITTPLLLPTQDAIPGLLHLRSQLRPLTLTIATDAGPPADIQPE